MSAFLFTSIARALAAEARRQGLVAPSFRTPPRSRGARRSLRRWPGGGAVVAVRTRGRPVDDVVADMVDGVLAVNRADARTAARVRPALHHAALRGDAAAA